MSLVDNLFQCARKTHAEMIVSHMDKHNIDKSVFLKRQLEKKKKMSHICFTVSEIKVKPAITDSVIKTDIMPSSEKIPPEVAEYNIKPHKEFDKELFSGKEKHMDKKNYKPKEFNMDSYFSDKALHNSMDPYKKKTVEKPIKMTKEHLDSAYNEYMLKVLKKQTKKELPKKELIDGTELSDKILKEYHVEVEKEIMVAVPTLSLDNEKIAKESPPFMLGPSDLITPKSKVKDYKPEKKGKKKGKVDKKDYVEEDEEDNEDEFEENLKLAIQESLKHSGSNINGDSSQIIPIILPNNDDNVIPVKKEAMKKYLDSDDEQEQPKNNDEEDDEISPKKYPITDSDSDDEKQQKLKIYPKPGW